MNFEKLLNEESNRNDHISLSLTGYSTWECRPFIQPGQHRINKKSMKRCDHIYDFLHGISRVGKSMWMENNNFEELLIKGMGMQY